MVCPLLAGESEGKAGRWLGGKEMYGVGEKVMAPGGRPKPDMVRAAWRRAVVGGAGRRLPWSLVGALALDPGCRHAPALAVYIAWRSR